MNFFKIFVLIFLLSSNVSSYAENRDRPISQEQAVALNEKLKQASDLVKPFIFLSDVEHQAADQRKIKQAIRLYDEILERVPDHWVSMFMKGKAFQALRDHPNAYESFKQAYTIYPMNADVLNEYMIEAIELDKLEEALEHLEAGQEQFPDDIGVQGNYALVLLLTGDFDTSLNVLQEVQQKWPEDTITRRMIPIVNRILSGEIDPPTTISELHAIARQP